MLACCLACLPSCLPAVRAAGQQLEMQAMLLLLLGKHASNIVYMLLLLSLTYNFHLLTNPCCIC
jgi:hypothetical protein